MKIQTITQIMILLCCWVRIDTAVAQDYSAYEFYKFKDKNGCPLTVQEKANVSLTFTDGYLGTYSKCASAPQTFLYSAAEKAYVKSIPQFQAKTIVWYTANSIRILSQSPTYHEDNTYEVTKYYKPISEKSLNCLGEKICVGKTGYLQYSTGEMDQYLGEIKSIKEVQYPLQKKYSIEKKHILCLGQKCGHNFFEGGTYTSEYENIPQFFTVHQEPGYCLQGLCVGTQALWYSKALYESFWADIHWIAENGQVGFVPSFSSTIKDESIQNFVPQEKAVARKEIRLTQSCVEVKKDEKYAEKLRKKYSAELLGNCLDSEASTPGWKCSSTVEVKLGLSSENFCQIFIQVQKQK